MYEYATGKVSDLVRQLSMAGIGVVWILRVGKDVGGIGFDRSLLIVLQCFVITLALDFLQYVSQSVVWGVYNYLKEHAGCKPSDMLHPHEAINWPGLIFFWGKTVLCAVSMWSLIGYLKEKL